MSNVRKNFLYNSLLTASKILFSVISFPYAARILGPTQIGKVNFVDGYVQYFILISALGIPLYGVREVAKMKNDGIALNKLSSELLIINFLGVLICIGLYFSFSILTHKFFNYRSLFLWGSGYLFFSMFLMEWYFQGMEEFKFIAIRGLIANAIYFFSLFIFVKKSEDLVLFFSLTVIVLIINDMVNSYRFFKVRKLVFKELNIYKHFKPLILLFSTQLAINVYLILDKIILGYLASDINVGYYSASLKITKIFLAVTGALALVIVPQMAKAFSINDNEKIRSTYSKSLNFVITIGTPLSLGLIFLSKEIMVIVSGTQFLPAVFSLQIIAPTILLIGLSNIFGIQILVSNGKEKILFQCVFLGTIINIFLNFFLIPRLLHDGAAISIFITELFVTVLTAYYACREIKVRFDWKLLIVNIVSCLPFIFFYIICPFSNAVPRLFFNVIFSGIYFSLIQIYILKNSLWREYFDRAIIIFSSWFDKLAAR